MNLDEPLRILSSALSGPGKRELPVGAGRWFVLFGGKQRPLLMPSGEDRLQKQCLPYFVGGRLKTLYARAMLKLNSLVPAAGLLPEFRLPRARRHVVSGKCPLGQSSHSVIQIGTTGPYQKASALLVSERGEGLALAKIALVPSADPMVAAEARWLRELAGIGELTDQVPRLLAEGKIGSGRRYLVTSLAPGTRVTTAFTPAHALFLRQLERARMETMKFEASPCRESLESTLAEIGPYVTRGEKAQLQDVLSDCRKLLSDFSGPFVFSQGDFTWWNIRLYQQRNARLLQQRIFVFDWEYARRGANPLADLFHYHLVPRAAAGRAIGRWFLLTVMRQALEFARESYPEWKWRPREVSALALVYVLEVFLHYCRASASLDRTDEVMRGYWRLMKRRSAWLAA